LIKWGPKERIFPETRKKRERRLSFRGKIGPILSALGSTPALKKEKNSQLRKRKSWSFLLEGTENQKEKSLFSPHRTLRKKGKEEQRDAEESI